MSRYHDCRNHLIVVVTLAAIVSVSTPLAAAKCNNNGVCDPGEKAQSCPADCGQPPPPPPPPPPPGDSCPEDPNLLGCFDGEGTFGEFAVAFVGDVTGGGSQDLAVGAPKFSRGNQQRNIGRVAFLNYDEQNGLVEFASVESSDARSQFGFQLAPAGDFTGGESPDLVVGAPAYRVGNKPGEKFLGRVWIVAGEAGHAMTLLDTGTVGGGWLGWSVAGLSDIDGDGLVEVAAGAPNLNEIRIYDRNGEATTLGAPAGAVGDFGQSLAGGVDIDGDLTPDFAVGASLAGSGGKVLVYSGDDLSAPAFELGGDAGSVQFGYRIALMADGCGVGCNAVAVADRDFNSANGSGSGAVYLFDDTGAQVFRADGTGGGDGLGSSIASAGDLDSDGIGDILTGARFADYVNAYSGADGDLIFTRTGDQLGSQLGSAVAGGTSVDGDVGAVPEIFVSSPFVNDGDGRVYLYTFQPQPIP